MKIKCLSNGLHSLKNCPNPFGKGFSHAVAKICANDSTKREIAEKCPKSVPPCMQKYQWEYKRESIEKYLFGNKIC